MNRAEIPGQLLRSRGADIDRIPSSVLAKMTRVDLVNRLVAVGEYRRRAGQRNQAPDAARMYADLACEALTTTDPRRAESLLKSAGVGVTIGAGRPSRPAPAASRTPARPPATGALRKAAPARSAEQQATLDHLAKVAVTAVERAAAGLGLQIDGVGLQLRGASGTLASAAGETLAKAARYERQAAIVTDPATRRNYLELAAQERQKAGAR